MISFFFTDQQRDSADPRPPVALERGSLSFLPPKQGVLDDEKHDGISVTPFVISIVVISTVLVVTFVIMRRRYARRDESSKDTHTQPHLSPVTVPLTVYIEDRHHSDGGTSSCQNKPAFPDEVISSIIRGLQSLPHGDNDMNEELPGVHFPGYSVTAEQVQHTMTGQSDIGNGNSDDGVFFGYRKDKSSVIIDVDWGDAFPVQSEHNTCRIGELHKCTVQ